MNIQNRQYLNNICGIGYNKSNEQFVGRDPRGGIAGRPDHPQQPAPTLGSGMNDAQYLQYLIANWDNLENAQGLLNALLAGWGQGGSW